MERSGQGQGPRAVQGRVVLGIDPGSRQTGFGFLGTGTAGIECLASGVVRLDETRRYAERLPQLRQQIVSLIQSHHPDEAVLETCFVARSVRAALVLGHIRGVLLLLCLEAGLDLFEYAPSEVKRTVTGNGGASKPQVQEMLRRLIRRLPERMVPDEADALAIAYCHLTRPALVRARPLQRIP